MRLNHKHGGVVLVIWALFLPLLFFIAGTIVLGGQSYIRRAELDHLAHQAGKASSVFLLDALELRAQQNYNLICSGEEPPTICSNGSISDFLDGADVASVIIETQSGVWQEVKHFAVTHDPSNNLDPHEIEVLYPYDMVHNAHSCAVKMQVTITDEIDGWFDSLGEGLGMITGKANIVIDLGVE